MTEHRLSGIISTNAAGWLATLGLFGICANKSQNNDVALRWDWNEKGSLIPVLRCCWESEALIDKTLEVLKDVGKWVEPNVWKNLTISGSGDGDKNEAMGLFNAHDVLHRTRSDNKNLPTLFCRQERNKNRLALSILLGGVTSRVSIQGVVKNIVNFLKKNDLSREDLKTTLYGPWKPRSDVEKVSFGFDWMTVSDGAKASGEVKSLPSRDLLALLGATWIADAPKGDRLVWGCWSKWMKPADVAVLVTRPELWHIDRQRIDLQTLRAWSFTHVMVSKSIHRGMNTKMKYKLWEDAEIIDIRAS